MKLLIQLLLIIPLIGVISVDTQAGRSGRSMSKRGRGIASVSKNYRFQVSNKEWNRLTKAQRYEYLTIIRDLAISLAMENKGFASYTPTQPAILNQFLFPKADAGNFALGTYLKNAKNDSFDTRKTFEDGDAIINTKTCPKSKKPCAVYLGLDGDGNVHCVNSTSTMACPSDNGTSIRNLATWLDKCRPMVANVRRGPEFRKCSSIIGNYDKQLAQKKAFCVKNPGKWCDHADKAIRDLVAQSPAEADSDKGLNGASQSCEKVAADIKSRGRQKYRKDAESNLNAANKPLEKELEGIQAEIIKQKARLKDNSTKASAKILLANLQEKEAKVQKKMDRINKIKKERPRAAKVNTKWKGLLRAVAQVCKNHSRQQGVNYNALEKTFGNCRLPDNEWGGPSNAAFTKSMQSLRRSGAKNVDEMYTRDIQEAVGVTPAQINQIFCNTPSYNAVGKSASGHFSSSFAKNFNYGDIIKNRKSIGDSHKKNIVTPAIGAEGDIEKSALGLWACVKDAAGHLRKDQDGDDQWIPPVKRGLQSHASKDQCSSSAIYNPFKAFKNATKDSPILYKDKKGFCHKIVGKATAKSGDAFDASDSKQETIYSIPTQTYKNGEPTGVKIIKLTRSQMKKQANKRKFFTHHCNAKVGASAPSSEKVKEKNPYDIDVFM